MFNFAKQFVCLYKTYYAKRLTSLYFISIVKREHLLLPFFFCVPTQKEKGWGGYKKIKKLLEENKKKISMRNIYRNS
jgi:hypothetical protein